MSDEPCELPVEPLTKEAFAPFGTVIEKDGAEIIPINQGTTDRFHALAELDVADGEGVPILSIFRASARPAPIKISMMERHPLGSQAFVPLSSEPWLVVVCGETPPRPGVLRAFLARGDQGVQYHKNVWHHPLLVLKSGQEFLVADRGGDGENLEECWFADDDFALLTPPA